MQKQNFYQRRKGTKKEKLYFPFLQQVTDYLAVSRDFSQWFSVFRHWNDHRRNQFLWRSLPEQLQFLTMSVEVTGCLSSLIASVFLFVFQPLDSNFATTVSFPIHTDALEYEFWLDNVFYKWKRSIIGNVCAQLYSTLTVFQNVCTNFNSHW